MYKKHAKKKKIEYSKSTLFKIGPCFCYLKMAGTHFCSRFKVYIVDSCFEVIILVWKYINPCGYS